MNVKTTKDKKYLKLAFEVSQLKQKTDALSKILKDKTKELKNFNVTFLPVEWLTADYTIVNGFTKEICNAQNMQNRSQYSIEAICSDLRVTALTVENGYRTPQPVACLKIGKMSARGF